MKKKTLSTRNQLERLILLHELLSTRFEYSLDDFARACETKLGDDNKPSVRTLYSDLERLREEYKAPLAPKNRQPKPYWYTRDDFSLYGVFNKEDAALAKEAVALLKQVSYLPNFAGLEDVFLKFEQRARTADKAEKNVIQFEQNLGYTGLKWLSDIYKAIQQDRQVWVTYTGFGQPSATLSFSPYLLKEYNNRWHVYGPGAESLGLNSLALDRIDALKIRPDVLRQPDSMDWDTHLADIIGFTHLTNMPLETWVLRVWLPRARYIYTKPLHTSQDKIAETDEFMDFKYQLRWNKELDAKILELGADAELLAPEKHRKRLANVVKAMSKRYA